MREYFANRHNFNKWCFKSKKKIPQIIPNSRRLSFQNQTWNCTQNYDSNQNYSNNYYLKIKQVMTEVAMLAVLDLHNVEIRMSMTEDTEIIK